MTRAATVGEIAAGGATLPPGSEIIEVRVAELHQVFTRSTALPTATASWTRASRSSS